MILTGKKHGYYLIHFTSLIRLKMYASKFYTKSNLAMQCCLSLWIWIVNVSAVIWRNLLLMHFMNVMLSMIFGWT